MASRIGAKIPAGVVRNDISDMLDRLFPAPEERALFVAGWRPTIGWVCALPLTWAFLLQPVAVWVVATFALSATVPAIVTDHLLEWVLAMLGIAGPSRR
jgi:hypothetical protein